MTSWQEEEARRPRRLGLVQGRGARCAQKKALVAFDHKGFRCMKPGDTYFHAFGTIIGSESLTTVFEMGTGVTFLI